MKIVFTNKLKVIYEDLLISPINNMIDSGPPGKGMGSTEKRVSFFFFFF